MKYIMVSLFLVCSHLSLAMEHGTTRSAKKRIEDKWFVSQIILKKERFNDEISYLTGREEFALALEPFYYLQSHIAGDLLVSSPIKEIKRVKNTFIIYTLTGSIYKAKAKDLLKMHNFDAYFRFLECEQLKVYRRRNLWQLKEEIDHGHILTGQNYKSWISFAWEEGDADLFNLSNKIKRMKNKEEMLFEITDDDLYTLMYF